MLTRQPDDVHVSSFTGKTKNIDWGLSYIDQQNSDNLFGLLLCAFRLCKVFTTEYFIIGYLFSEVKNAQYLSNITIQLFNTNFL